MSAGAGVLHSEMNHSKTESVHFLQIWLLPDEHGIQPEYEQKYFSVEDKQGRFRLVASRGGRDGAVAIHQDVDLYAGVFATGDSTTLDLRLGRHAWVQMARGGATLNGQSFDEGDGAAFTEESRVELVAATDGEVLVFDLA